MPRVGSNIPFADTGSLFIPLAALEPFINRQPDEVWTKVLSEPNVVPTRREKAISSWLWVSSFRAASHALLIRWEKITRALLLRGDERAMVLQARLFDLIGGADEAVSWQAARAVGQVVDSKCGVLSKANHSVLRVSIGHILL